MPVFLAVDRFLVFRQICGLSTLTENVPKYSCFGYQLSWYIFPKKLGIPKLLSICMTLIWMNKMEQNIVKSIIAITSVSSDWSIIIVASYLLKKVIFTIIQIPFVNCSNSLKHLLSFLNRFDFLRSAKFKILLF